MTPIGLEFIQMKLEFGDRLFWGILIFIAFLFLWLGIFEKYSPLWVGVFLGGIAGTSFVLFGPGGRRDSVKRTRG